MPKNSLTIDVTPTDLIDGGRRIPLLRDILDEIDKQWPQGRDPSGNGHGTRIGTLHLYFDANGVLHIHFAERGEYLDRTSSLKKVPLGRLEGYYIDPVFNYTDTPAAAVGEQLVSMDGASAEDVRWAEVLALLKAMKKEPRVKKQARPRPLEPAKSTKRKAK